MKLSRLASLLVHQSRLDEVLDMGTTTRWTEVRAATLCGIAMLGAAGCKKTADNTVNYKSALNTYYAAHPACLWSEEKKFPVQEDTGDTTKTSPYDALVDQGLLMRTTEQKKQLLVLSKQVTNYDLTDKGRSGWTADPNQPGFGNFCYGHRSVSSIDSATPTNDKPGATTQVTYHYGFSDASAWATAPETQTAFPSVAANLAAGQTASATLTNTPNGWAVTTASGSSKTASPADGKVVE